jgi:hypothetical protein
VKTYKGLAFQDIHITYASKYGRRWLGATQVVRRVAEHLKFDHTTPDHKLLLTALAAEMLDIIELEIEHRPHVSSPTVEALAAHVAAQQTDGK